MKIYNKKAKFNFHILETLEVGIALSGAEVKSIRAGRIDLGESFIKILNNEAYLINANIPKFEQTSSKNYDPYRTRKLLLHRHQIDSLLGKTSGTGATLIPLSLYQKNNRFKLEVALAKSKKQFDKRKVLKERDHQRKIEQELRGKE